VDFSRSYMKQVVAIHQAMFEKLLFAEDAATGRDLAELFRDAGRTYLQISERINETCLSEQFLQD
jgi:predicted nucleotidyltransferase component of viral defense system